MHGVDIFSLTQKGVREDILAIDSGFINALAGFAASSAEELKVLSVVLRDQLSNRGEIAKKGISPLDKSVVDICKLTPLTGLGGRSLLEEVALYRLQFINDGSKDLDFNKIKYTLFVDYLLASCVCYVEEFTATGVNKFFATRNIALASYASGSQLDQKYKHDLETSLSDYKQGNTRILKLTSLRDGSFKVVKPRNFFNVSNNVKVTPLFFMTIFLDKLQHILENNIVKFTYVKDNLIEREFVTTLSKDILMRYYDVDYVQKLINGVEVVINRGYVKLPELGISKYDETGVRSLNISRITSMCVVDDIDSRFINVDFSNILTSFRDSIEQIRDMRVLAFIFEELSGQVLSVKTVIEARNFILSYVDSQNTIFTTTFLRKLHIFMISLHDLFGDYDGLQKQYTGKKSFDLGRE